MSTHIPKITSLRPIVSDDQKRVSLEMHVANLPDLLSNIMLMDESYDPSQGPPPKRDPSAPSPFPNVELALLDADRKVLADLLIVEHKEEYTALTLHIRTPNPTPTCFARAEMSHNNEVFDVVEVAFNLSDGQPTHG